jgi:hypothetical protein
MVFFFLPHPPPNFVITIFLEKLVRFTLERKRKKCQIFPFFEKPKKKSHKKEKEGSRPWSLHLEYVCAQIMGIQ